MFRRFWRWDRNIWQSNFSSAAPALLPQQPGERPTTAAVRMANALMLEQILGTGAFGNASELARAVGISKDVVSELLALLDTPVAEMERILFETH